ncbi:MAG: HEAT repeat domain-containing protein, partial [Polyangiaceae bacterium]|nr:HEAT repeat domain-containing protein [Polyangiaceae bacterium]
MGAFEPTDASFLGQLSVSGATELAVDDLDDPRTLVCVLRAGSLRQRRAAARRLTSLLRETESIDHAADVGREIRDLREAAIEHELRELRAEVPGGRSDEEDAPLGPTVKEVERAIRAFWEAETSTEPLAELGNVRRVLLLHRMRELPDAIVRHVAAVIEGEDGTSSISARREIASVCRHAGDPRLVPALTGVLSAGPVELRVDAARALAGIEDRRVAPALRAAYERSVDERERAEIGGALGAAGDMRAAPFVRSLLSRDDRELRLAALRALEHLGDTADVDALMAGLVPGNDEEVWQTIRTLGRIGDGRALPVLGQLHTSASIPGLRAE